MNNHFGEIHFIKLLLQPATKYTIFNFACIRKSKYHSPLASQKWIINNFYITDAGLDAVNISLDTLHAKKFEFVSRRPAAGHKKVN